MIIFDDILSFFDPDNFMPIYVITWVVLVAVGYLLLGFNIYVVVAAAMAIWAVFTPSGVHLMAFATKLPLYGIIIVAVFFQVKWASLI